MARNEDFNSYLVVIFQLVIFTPLWLAAIWLEKINNGWWLTFHTRCNVIDIWFFGDGLPFFQHGVRSLTIGSK